MAVPNTPTSDQFEKLADDLECPVCLSLYDDPRVLDCMHTFCLSCLLRGHQAGSDNNALTCCVCRKVTPVKGQRGVSALRSNYVVRNIVDTVRRLQEEEEKRIEEDKRRIAEEQLRMEEENRRIAEEMRIAQQVRTEEARRRDTDGSEDREHIAEQRRVNVNEETSSENKESTKKKKRKKQKKVEVNEAPTQEETKGDTKKEKIITRLVGQVIAAVRRAMTQAREKAKQIRYTFSPAVRVFVSMYFRRFFSVLHPGNFVPLSIRLHLRAAKRDQRKERDRAQLKETNANPIVL